MRRALFLAALLLATAHGNAQGCSQCRDNVSQASPQQQHAYREAIALMAVAAVSLFAGVVLLARKFR